MNFASGREQVHRTPSNLEHSSKMTRTDADNDRRGCCEFVFEVLIDGVERLSFAPKQLCLPFDKSSRIPSLGDRLPAGGATIRWTQPCSRRKLQHSFAEAGQRPATSLEGESAFQATSVRRRASPEGFGSSCTIRPE